MRTLNLMLIFAIIIGCGICSTFAQEREDFKKHPGYIDFGNLDAFKDAEETVEVFIKGPLLKFVSIAAAEEDPALSKLLDDLLLIRVNVFSIEKKQTKEIKKIISTVSKKLNSKNWERMVRVKEPEEQVEIFTQFNNNNELSGLVIMAVEENDEAVFVNIVGKIDPDQLGKLSSKFNIPKLDSIKIENKKK